MGRGTWAIKKKVDDSWVSDGTLFRPNESFRIPKISTQIKVKLAKGSNAYMTPSTKYTDEAINWVWYWEDGTTKTKIEGYINNQDDIKITDDLGNDFIGRFISIDSSRIFGTDEERYDITSIFERMDL